MKNSTIIRQLRERRAPSIDGSYVLLCRLPNEAYFKAGHPAYTPAQIEAERKALGRGIAAHVYFIRDEHLPAPYWISPYRQAIRAIVVKDQSVRLPHVVFNVAPSRNSRGTDGCEVAIPVVVLKAKSRPEAEAHILEQLRGAIAAVLLTSTPTAA